MNGGEEHTIGDQHTGDAGRGQGGEDTGDQGGDGNLCDATGSVGGESGKHTDLDTD